MDQIWSLVGSKHGQLWWWQAIDQDRKEMIGVHVGDGSRAGARALWESLPGVYRQCALGYTDVGEAYKQVLPEKRHRGLRKQSGRRSGIEKDTGGELLRQRDRWIESHV